MGLFKPNISLCSLVITTNSVSRATLLSINNPELRYLLNVTNYKSEMRSIYVPSASLIWY